MNEEEYLALLKSFSQTCKKVCRKVEAWKKQNATPGACQTNARLSYHFRPNSIFAIDALRLCKNAILFDEKESKKMIASLGTMLRSVASGCAELITAPALKISGGEAAVKKWLELLYERLNEELPSDGIAPLVFPTQGDDISKFRNEIKNYVHLFALQLIQDSRLKGVFGFPQARDYIVNCTRGSLHYKKCKQIQDTMIAFGWKPSSLLTFCKGGSNYGKKTNDKRQGKSGKKKRLVQKDLNHAWHDAVP